MDAGTADSFARSWLRAWNSHDLDAILDHFADDAVFTSPIAAQLIPSSGGVLHGKDAIRAYWAEGLRRIPDLRFNVEAVYTGVDTLVINYRNHLGALVCEVLRLADGLVVRGDGTYLSDDAASASGVTEPGAR
jgi:ketosteroid isomerase-like protein